MRVEPRCHDGQVTPSDLGQAVEVLLVSCCSIDVGGGTGKAGIVSRVERDRPTRVPVEGTINETGVVGECRRVDGEEGDEVDCLGASELGCDG